METDTSDLFIEALEVYIHSILYTRNIYPKKIFKMQKLYNTPIFVSIYPPLNDYIRNTLKAAKDLKDNKDLYKVELVIYKNDYLVYETYVFEVDENNPALYEAMTNNDRYLIKFEEDIRRSLLLLSTRVKALENVGKDAKFKIRLHTNQTGFVQMSSKSSLQDFPWLQDTDDSPLMDKNQVSILPVTAVDRFGMQIYVEQF